MGFVIHQHKLAIGTHVSPLLNPSPTILLGLLLCPWMWVILRSLVCFQFEGGGERWGFPDSSVGKESACNARDCGSIPELRRSAGEGIGYLLQYSWASLMAQTVKNLPAMPETPRFSPWVGKIPGEGNGYPLQYSGLENSMDCIIHGVTKS